jgi:hypothetical protein
VISDNGFTITVLQHKSRAEVVLLIGELYRKNKNNSLNSNIILTLNLSIWFFNDEIFQNILVIKK